MLQDINRIRSWFVFYQQDRCYGFDYDCFVMEARIAPLTPVPGAAELVLGVMNIMGEIVTVIDIPNVLGRPQIKINSYTQLIVIEEDCQKIGIPTGDSIGKVEGHEIVVGDCSSTITQSSFVHQIGRWRNSDITLLSLDKILQNQSEKEVNESLGA